MEYNLIVVFDCGKPRVLMCRRKKNPYRGMLNFVGGKIEKDENHLEAAYRELWEETSILKENIQLVHIMDFSYPLEQGFMEVYAGVLNGPVQVKGTENELIWVNTAEDFSDTKQFGGCGNIYHIMNYLKTYQYQIKNYNRIRFDQSASE